MLATIYHKALFLNLAIKQQGKLLELMISSKFDLYIMLAKARA